MPGPMRVLIAGGGVAAVEGALALRDLAGERVAVELLTPRPELIDRPHAVLTPFDGALAPRVPLARLAERGIAVRLGALQSVDAAAGTVRTRAGLTLPYDRLVIAVGARVEEDVHGAIPFSGLTSGGAVEDALRRLAGRGHGRLVLTVPGAPTWPLPAYELALLSARALRSRGAAEVEVEVVTPELRPLGLFGRVAADAVARLLDEAAVAVRTAARARSVHDGALLLEDGGVLRADAVVALPRVDGPRIPGLPADARGFLPVDEHCRVRDCRGVYAAGDVTAGAIKQGGLAAQQADAAAEAIAAEAGAPVTPTAYRPALRAVLLTGEEPLYLCADLAADGPSRVSREPLWSPPAKIAGRHLAAFVTSGGAARGVRTSPPPLDGVPR